MNNFFEEVDLVPVASEIYATPFFSEEALSFMEDICLSFSGWKPHTDKYATQDCCFSENYPTLYEMVSDQFKNVVLELSRVGWVLDTLETTDIFAVKYAMDKQKSLKSHVDNSYISASIKVNSNYGGAELKFPRQNFSNKSIPPGYLIVWPSLITHPHYCSKLTFGEKYSITVWTKNNS